MIYNKSCYKCYEGTYVPVEDNNEILACDICGDTIDSQFGLTKDQLKITEMREDPAFIAGLKKTLTKHYNFMMAKGMEVDDMNLFSYMDFNELNHTAIQFITSLVENYIVGAGDDDNKTTMIMTTFGELMYEIGRVDGKINK